MRNSSCVCSLSSVHPILPSYSAAVEPQFCRLESAFVSAAYLATLLALLMQNFANTVSTHCMLGTLHSIARE